MHDVLEDDRLRYLDVLLEEELAAAPQRVVVPPPPPRPRRWLAAALVLAAIGVVVGTRWLQREDRAVAQDPQPAVEFVPADDADLAAFLQRVSRVGVERFRKVARYREDGPDAEVIAEEVRVTIDESTRALLAGWRSVPVGDEVTSGTVYFTTAEGQEFAARYSTAGQLWAAGRSWQLSDEGARQLAALSASPAAVATQMVVYRASGLVRVPDSLRVLGCPGVPAETLQDVLPRLRELQTLSFGTGIDDRGAVVVGRVPQLRDLSLAHPDLGPAGWAALAKAPRLRSLTVQGQVDGLVPEVLGRLAARLALLRLCGSHGGSAQGIAQEDAEFPVSAEQLQAIVSSPTLVDLRVAVAWDSSEAGEREAERLLDALVAMPRLRRLAFAARNGDPQALWTRLGKSSLEKLKLAGFGLDEAEVDVLAGMTSLRELDLRGCGFTPRARRAVGGLSQLTRLDVGGCSFPGQDLEALRERLPGATVLGEANVSTRSYPLLGAPSWTRD